MVIFKVACYNLGMKRVCLLIAVLLLLVGCGQGESSKDSSLSPKSDENGKSATVSFASDATASPSPLPTAVPTPTPIFSEPNEKGDIEINADLLSTLPATTYTVPADTVILIYHTHAAEAYRQEGKYTYKETEPDSYRTLDESKSVIAVGEALKIELEGYGYTVIHDTTNVEAPELTSAYSRSCEVMLSHPEADIFIDLHRNAANVMFKSDDVVILNEKRCAKMFFVVGTGIGTYEGEYAKTPNWKSNYRLALSLTEELRAISPELATDIRTKVGRYNQHVSDMCILLELGHNANTMDDVLNSVPYFASAFSKVILLDKVESEPSVS